MAVALFVSASTTAPAQTLVPLDPALLTLQWSPGIASWNGDDFTQDISSTFPHYGGYTQSLRLGIGAIPDHVIGISFGVSTALQAPRVSVSFLGYNGFGVNALVVSYSLFNYEPSRPTGFSNWTQREYRSACSCETDVF